MSIQLLLEDADKWYNHYSWLNRSKRNEFLKETFSYPLSEEFIKDIDIVDVLITHLNYLETERQYAEMIELYDAIMPQKQVLGNDLFYVDDYFIDYYLFKHDPDGVKKHLISFKEYPIKAIDSLTNVFNKLIFYNYTDIALDIAIKIYPEIFHAGELMPDTDHDYAGFIYMEKIQEIYQTLTIAGIINKPKIKKYLKKYGFVIKDELEIMECVLADDFSDYPDIADFYQNRSKFMFKILLLFLKYMYKEKNVSFPAASLIWFEAMDILINEDQIDDSEAGFAEIYALDPELYRSEIYKRFDFLSINTASAVALAWGMSYVYDFLKKYDYISNIVHNSAMTEILSIQAEIIKARADELWKYNYLHQWVRPDSVEEKDFIKEKEDFEYTFSNIIKTVKEPYSFLEKVAKKVPIKVVKIGRNDPCPCGSGKKYKKCCELSEGRLFE